MNTDDLETRLSRQPLRPPPPHWRAEILAACGAPVSDPARVGSSSDGKQMCRSGDRRSVPWWLAWLVPGRAGWATLGAVWGVIVLLHFANAPEAGRTSPASVAISPEAWEERRRLMAELLPPDEPAPAPAVTRPRGDRRDDATLTMTA